MKIYIKSDFNKKITFTTRELVWKMWFKERNGKKISYSNVGDDEMLQDDFYFGAELRKWASVDERWDKAPFIIPSNPWLSLQYEDIELEFEHAFISDDREKGEFLRIASTHVDILMVDKRALYVMAIKVASAIDGQISEDGKQSWLSVEEFKEYQPRKTRPANPPGPKRVASPNKPAAFQAIGFSPKKGRLRAAFFMSFFMWRYRVSHCFFQGVWPRKISDFSNFQNEKAAPP